MPASVSAPLQIPLEDLDYQRRAIAAAVDVLEGQTRNSFENSNLFGIQANVSDLLPEQIEANKRRIIAENGISVEDAKLSSDPDVCIEMETGTGKTLVYLRTVYELYRLYRHTKFILFVPSLAIKEGFLATAATFKAPLENRYRFAVTCFPYDSSKPGRLRQFIEDTQPQIMVMTIQSITSDDRIINQTGRDDSFMGLTFLQALGRCQPVVLMDEPQEGMDTPNAISRLATLNPLIRLRYSATHKVVKNLLYRLTPFDAYNQGLVKKIEVLSVAEKNDEATLKLELVSAQTKVGSKPKAKLLLWRKSGDGFKWKETNWLKEGDRLEEKSCNVSYRNYVIGPIRKSLRDGKWHLTFANGVELIERERAADHAGLFGQQLQWLIRRHFEKKPTLAARGIKCLSLIFIDRVDSYVREDGLIRRLFREEYIRVWRESHPVDPDPEAITAAQGYYFAKTGGSGGEYTDSENAMLRNKEIFDRILKEKDRLLSFADPIEFIFSHSALGVGWDNPNIFNIATLNQSYSDTKKRQELGRGLRICRNQQGQRIYDSPDVVEGQETNLLTVVPNETYEAFAAQYQEQMKDAYGSAHAGSPLRKKHRGQDEKKTLRRTARFESKSFRAFWERLARKTDYTVAFDEEAIINRAIVALDALIIGEYQAEVTLTRIKEVFAETMTSEEVGREIERLRATFSPLDLIQELSAQTSLSYPAALRIMGSLTNLAAINRNPARFLAEACGQVRTIELEEMLRTLSYHPTGETIPLAEFEEVIETFLPVQPTPQRGVYDGVAYGSSVEQNFARAAEGDNEVVCFLKLPKLYRIPTPIGTGNTGFYEPDFGLVLRRHRLLTGEGGEYYFVVETKSTNNLDDSRALTESERAKIRCAMKHFEAIGVEAQLNYLPYRAPVKDYRADFKDQLTLSPADANV